MEDKLSIILGTDHAFECDTDIIGREGEGNTTRLEITVPEKLVGCDVYLDFEKPNGEKLRTPKLKIENGVAIYDVVKYLLAEDGEIKVQAVLVTDAEKTWKSSIKKFHTQNSINALEEIPDREDLITEAIKLIATAEEAMEELNRSVEAKIIEMFINSASIVQIPYSHGMDIEVGKTYYIEGAQASEADADKTDIWCNISISYTAGSEETHFEDYDEEVEIRFPFAVPYSDFKEDIYLEIEYVGLSQNTIHIIYRVNGVRETRQIEVNDFAPAPYITYLGYHTSLYGDPNKIDALYIVNTNAKIKGEKGDVGDGGIIVDNYREAFDLLISASAEDYKLGQAIYVRQNGVPDLYISDVDPDNFISDQYTTDTQFIADMKDPNGLYRCNVGHYSVSIIETDLSDCAKKNEVNTLVNGVSAKADKNANDIVAVNSRIDRTAKQVENLIAGIPDDDFVIDNSTAYVRDVPSNALPFAEVTEIGGMTYKEGNVLRSAPVTEVVSEGVQLIPYPYAETTTTKGGVTFTDKGDGGITLSGTGTGTVAFYLYQTPNKPLPVGYYSVIANNVCDIRCYHADQTATTFASTGGTINITKPIVHIALLVREGQTYNGTVYPIINRGTTALPYRPYIKRTLSIPEAVQALPDYGVGIPNTDYFNRIRWRYDEATDKWVREYVRQTPSVDMGTLYGSLWAGDAHTLAIPIENIVPTAKSVLCDKYNTLDIDTNQWSEITKYDKVIYKPYGDKYVLIRDTNYSNASTFRQALQGVRLVYPIATPEITDISSILPEDNLIGVEGGGSITMANEYGYDVPAKVTYQIEEATV